jgi:hypothetical protein
LHSGWRHDSLLRESEEISNEWIYLSQKRDNPDAR